jgi:hypothetical protein
MGKLKGEPGAGPHGGTHGAGESGHVGSGKHGAPGEGKPVGQGTPDGATSPGKTKGPPANNGDAKPHGGPDHNKAIDDHINELKKDPEVTNIRKNQEQVDVNGDKAGKNRPDVQYDKGGVHHNVEYDRTQTNSDAHKSVVTAKDPNATYTGNILPKPK